MVAVASGQRAIGVEERSEPNRAVHHNSREEVWHFLHELDRRMESLYPGQQPFSLAQTFFHPDQTAKENLAGRVKRVLYSDDRGDSSASIYLPAPEAKDEVPGDGSSTPAELLNSPSLLQYEILQLEKMFRAYAKGLQAIDEAEGRYPPRVTIYDSHRVTEQGITLDEGGHWALEVEPVLTKNQPRKTNAPISDGEAIDLGVPDLCLFAVGSSEQRLTELGAKQVSVTYDDLPGHEGTETALASAFLAGNFDLQLDGTHRRRIASAYAPDGREFWVRQIAVGHEDDPEVCWVLVEKPPFLSFEPAERIALPLDFDQDSPKYRALENQLRYEYYLGQVALVLNIDEEEVAELELNFGPEEFLNTDKVVEDVRLSPNAIVFGDSTGVANVGVSGGATVGLALHGPALLRFFDSQTGDDPVPREQALTRLAEELREATLAWIKMSKIEYLTGTPTNMGKEAADRIEHEKPGATTQIAPNVGTLEDFEDVGLVPLQTESWDTPAIPVGRPTANQLRRGHFISIEGRTWEVQQVSIQKSKKYQNVHVTLADPDSGEKRQHRFRAHEEVQFREAVGAPSDDWSDLGRQSELVSINA